MTQRRVTTILLIAATGILTFFVGLSLFEASINPFDVVGLLLFGALLAAHLWGWRWSPEALVFLITLLIITSAPSELDQRAAFSFTIVMPAILAAVILSWRWSLAAFVVCFIGIAAQWQFQGLFFSVGVLPVIILQIVGVILASVIARHAQRIAEANAEAAERSRLQAESQARELTAQSAELRQQNEQQQRLLNLVTTLETPAVALADGVVLAPVVGHLDSRRAQALTTRLLQEVSDQRAQLVVIDIAGVSAVDTEVAQALLRASQAVRLLGCRVIITGISASVATTLTHIGINLGEVATARTPQEALAKFVSVAVDMPVYGQN